MAAAVMGSNELQPKSLPRSAIAEESVVGCMLHDFTTARPATAAAGLQPHHFEDRLLGAIYAGSIAVAAEGEDVNQLTTYAWLQGQGGAYSGTSFELLHGLAYSVPSAVNAGSYARIVVEEARRREVVAAARRLQNRAETGAPLDDVWADVRAMLDNAHADDAQRIRVEWAADLPDDLQAPAQLVEGLLTVGGLSMVFGESNSGKSYLATHLALRIAAGETFLGLRTRKGTVLYGAGEGAWSIRNRVRAYERYFGAKAGRFGLVPQALGLLDPSEDVEALITLAREIEQRDGERVSLIVVDTVARSMVGGDENAAVDMGRLVGGADRLREATGAHVLLIHHAGKDSARGARGHSSLRAALDTEIEVTADEAAKLHYAKVTKQRDLPSKGEKFAARLVPVELGRDEWGNAITACAVEAAEADEKGGGRPKLTPSQHAVLAFLRGRDGGIRKAELVKAIEPQGVSRPAAYKALTELQIHGLTVEVAGQVYLPKEG